MSLNIKHPEAHRLASELAALTGESKTATVIAALRERLEREKRARGREGVAERLLAIGRRTAARPVLDPRSPDELLDYDEDGLPR